MVVVFSVGILVSLLSGNADRSKLNENLFFSFKKFKILRKKENFNV
jgi:hypothetical protein